MGYLALYADAIFMEDPAPGVPRVGYLLFGCVELTKEHYAHLITVWTAIGRTGTNLEVVLEAHRRAAEAIGDSN